jgi:MoaA/NifB/PqqE/SkfB family radical SAM enzyme
MLFRKGARSLILVGGEPSVYPHLLETLSFAKDLGYVDLVMDTNGMRFADPEFVDACIDAGLTRVTMSVHSHIPSIEESLVRVPGVLAKKIQALDHLVDRRERGRLRNGLGLNPVLCRPNLAHAEDYVRFFLKRGIYDFHFNFIWPQSQVEKDKSVIPTYREALPTILRLILANEREWKVFLNFGAVPYCVLPESLHGNWPLLRKYFGEYEKDLKHISEFHTDSEQRYEYERMTRDSDRSKVEACRNCRLETVCFGVYKSYLDLYGADEFESVAGEVVR